MPKKQAAPVATTATASSSLQEVIEPGVLWTQENTSFWHYYNAKYEEAIRNKSEETLPNLEQYVWEQLIQAINKRKQPHMTAAEYRQLIDWKLQRGKFRPSLQAFAKHVDNKDIIDRSKTAFAQVKKDGGKDVSAALKPLLEIKGCGPATASAILSVFNASFPFMSDELLQMTTGKKYTKKVYVDMVTMVREKAKSLSTDNCIWTPRNVERSAFAFSNGILSPTAAQLKEAATTDPEETQATEESEDKEEEEEEEMKVNTKRGSARTSQSKRRKTSSGSNRNSVKKETAKKSNDVKDEEDEENHGIESSPRKVSEQKQKRRSRRKYNDVYVDEEQRESPRRSKRNRTSES